MMKDAKIDVSKVDLHDGNYFKKICDRQLDIGKKFYYFLATGNLVSTSGLDLMQVSGLFFNLLPSLKRKNCSYFIIINS